jgi:transposase
VSPSKTKYPAGEDSRHAGAAGRVRQDASTIERFATYVSEHGGSPEQVSSVSIDMSPAFIKGVNEHLPKARVTVDKFHVVAHASKALDSVPRQQQKLDPQLRGMR